MEALTDALTGFDPDIDEALAKGLRALSARLASYAHAPLNEAQVRRMDRFCQTPGLCDYVDRFLQSWVGGERFGDLGVSGVSEPAFWYCLALLLQSPDEHPFVHAFAHRSLSAPKNLVSVFVRLLRCSTSDHYAALLEELSAYERELARATEGWRWAEAIGLELPTERPWRISAMLLCVPESPAVGRVTLAVEADSVRFGVRSYRLHLRGREPTPFSESWDDDATVARVGFRDGPRVLQTAPRLLKVPELLSELEGVLDVSFSYSLGSTRLSRGVKGKARLADWLLQASTHP